MLQKAFIPYGGYFSSPFARWQGSMANEKAIFIGSGLNPDSGLPDAGKRQQVHPDSPEKRR